MSKEENNLLIAASGTGGHIFPALAVAKKVDQFWKIYWLGIKRRCDTKFVPKKYNFLTLNIDSPKKNLFLIIQYLRILFSTFEVMKTMKEKKN